MAQILNASNPPSDPSDLISELETLMSKTFFSPTTYTYKPLIHKSIIRLLTLSPGPPSSPLSGTLSFAPLLNPGTYSALSYAWGPPVRTSTITISGLPLPITPSAHEFLLRLRHAEKPYTVWIDSVCINQDDDEEKSLQVAAMGDIYASAEVVLCWLGEDEEGRIDGEGVGDGALTFDLIDRIGRADFTYLEDDLLTSDFMEYNDLPFNGDPQWHAAARVFRRPWFRRQWVVQEVVLGKDVEIMLGGAIANWLDLVEGLNLMVQYSMVAWGTADTFLVDDVAGVVKHVASEEQMGMGTFQNMIACRVMRTKGFSYMEAVRSMFNRDEKNRLAKMAVFQSILGETNLGVIFGALGSMVKFSDTSVVMAQIALAEMLGVDLSHWGKHISLSELAIQFPSCISTDPRDRFYAFLAMSKEKDEPALQPDYSESVRSTFIRFARYFLLGAGAKGGLIEMPLIEAGMARHGPVLDLPTWISDTTHTAYSKLLVYAGLQATGYKAAGESTRQFRATDDKGEIAVTAGFVDRISQILPQPSYPPESEKEYREFLDEFDRMTASRETPYPYTSPGETWLNIQWRTLVANSDSSGKEPGEDWMDSYREDRYKMEIYATDLEQWKALADPGERMLSLNWGIRWAVLAKVCSVCQTESGLIGLVPNGAQIGDSLWIILGETMPFVLRRADYWDKYKVFGACYIHGIMHGEAMEAKSWQEELITLV